MAIKRKTTRSAPRPAVCRTCGSRCCKYVSFDMPEPATVEDFENARWFLMHGGVTIHINELGEWYMVMEHRCGELDENNLCRHYDKRPLVCRNYRVETCEFTQGDHESSMAFAAVDELDQYVAKVMGKRKRRPRKIDK